MSLTEGMRERAHNFGQNARAKTTVKGWVLPKQESSWAPPGTWTNIDLDITPTSRQTWTAWTILGYWMSDVVSIQSWQTGSSILAVGLTWREAIFSIIFGSFVMAIPVTLNGYVGAKTHAPFPVLARSSFGYHFAKFPVIIRLITCFFWHAITNWLAVAPMTQIIRSIWPSYRHVPNSLPLSAGITTQQMCSYFLVWLVQVPLLMIPPHRMFWLFTTKAVMMAATVAGMLIWICVRAGGSGDIWKQEASATGWEKSWLIMWALNSCTASWSTVGVNIPDFTRYMQNSRSSLSQVIWFPVICSYIAIIGIVVTSASGVVYGTLLWDPIAIIDTWEGPGGRAAAFFAGVSWCIAQICVNISATVISGANDLTSLWPRWMNIRRGALLLTIIGAWALVPWKILQSAASLLNFMNSLGIFLAPIMGIQVSDFFLVKSQALDIPDLYNPDGRYSYMYGFNWRAVLAMVAAVGPTLPGLINSVNADIDIGGAAYLRDLNWYYGFFSAAVVYTGSSYLMPASESLVQTMVWVPEGFVEDGEVLKEEMK